MFEPPSDERGVTRKYPLSDVVCDSDALNVNTDIVGEIPRHLEPGSADASEVTRNPRDDDVMPLDIDSYISSSLEQITFGDDIVQKDTNHIACAVSQSDDDYQLYTLVNSDWCL